MTESEKAEVNDWEGRKALAALDLNEAVTYLELAIKQDPTKPLYFMHLAKAYRASERYEDAVVSARKVLAMPGVERNVRLAAAITAGDSLRYCLDEKRKQCGNDPPLTDAEVERLDKKGQELLGAKKADESLAVFLRAYAYSGKPRPLLRIATFEYVTGNYADAFVHARWVRIALPKNAKKLAAENEELIGAIAVQCKKITTCISFEFSEPRTRQAEPSPKRRSSATSAAEPGNDPEVLTTRGNEALAAGDIIGAIGAFERAEKMDPQNAKYVFNLAIAYQVGWLFSDAISAAQRVLKLALADRAMRIEAATIAGDTIRFCIDKQLKDCITTPLLTTAELGQLDKDGQAFLQAKQTDEALATFLRAYAFSGNARPLLRIATFEYVTGYYADALKHARRVRDGVKEATTDLRKETDELIRVIEADCKRKKADCEPK